MTDVIPLRGRTTRDDRVARVGMIVFVAGWTMMFGALLVAYAMLRTGQGQEDRPSWPPRGLPALELTLPTIATTVLLTSSATLQLGLVALRTARPSAFVRYLWTTLVLAIGFLSLQIASWVHMAHRGLDPTGSVYAACFFGLTSFHALHVVVGVIGLVTLLPRALRGSFSAHQHIAVKSWALYWHFVDLVWIAFFLEVYVW